MDHMLAGAANASRHATVSAKVLPPEGFRCHACKLAKRRYEMTCIIKSDTVGNVVNGAVRFREQKLFRFYNSQLQHVLIWADVKYAAEQAVDPLWADLQRLRHPGQPHIWIAVLLFNRNQQWRELPMPFGKGGLAAHTRILLQSDEKRINLK